MKSENDEKYGRDRDKTTGRFNSTSGTHGFDNRDYKEKKNIRKYIDQLVKSNLEDVQDALDEVREASPKDYILLLMNFMEFVQPKLSRQEIQQENTNKLLVIAAPKPQELIDNTINIDNSKIEDDDE